VATVFANSMSIACKAASGKSAAAMPDVCLSPPSPPAGPIPIPYPNTASASDTDKGSKTVQIGGKEVMLKDQSVFKTSMGNEAATKSFGMGVVTHQIQGESSFVAWSMDVKFEGENVPRHLDLMGHNEACKPDNTTPWPYLDEADLAPGGACSNVSKKFKLVPYKDEDDELSCKPKTGHHLIPGRCMMIRTTAGGNPAYPKGCSHDKAPCVCVNNENQHDGTHRDCHSVFDPIELAEGQRTGGTITYAKARDAAAKSAKGVNNNKALSEKEQGCIKTQLDNYYKNCLKNQDGSASLSAKLKASTEAHGGLVLPGTPAGG
jgi:Domain of unknown function (DUF4150)